MLKILFELTSRQINEINDGKRPQTTKDKRSIKFVRPGQRNIIRSTKKTVDDERWSGHWEVAADLPGRQSPFVIPSPKKPDIVVWCTERKIVFLVKLIVPREDNIDAAQARKEDRYEELLEKCEDAGWSASHFPVEVGCRGFVGNRLKSWLTTIGLKKRGVNEAIKKIEETTEKASHWIWLKRSDNCWLEG